MTIGASPLGSVPLGSAPFPVSSAGDVSVVMEDSLLVASATSTNGSLLYFSIADTQQISTNVLFTATCIIADVVELLTTSGASRCVDNRSADTLHATALSSVQVELLTQIADLLSLYDEIGHAFGLNAEDAVVLADALQGVIASFLNSTDSLAMLDEAQQSLVVVTRGGDTWAGTDDLGVNLAVALHAPETLAFVGRLPLVEGDFQAWVVNTDTLGATSYANFPFNSMYTHAGKTWGVTETGLYELAGEDDDGTPIDAMLRTGMLDFGSSWIKMAPRCYLYLHSDGRTMLRTISDSGGARTDRWYAVHALGGDALRIRPVRLGRGLRFVAMAFELTNVDGSSLDLSGVEVVPVILRRI